MNMITMHDYEWQCLFTRLAIGFQFCIQKLVGKVGQGKAIELIIEKASEPKPMKPEPLFISLSLRLE